MLTELVCFASSINSSHTLEDGKRESPGGGAGSTKREAIVAQVGADMEKCNCVHESLRTTRKFQLSCDAPADESGLEHTLFTTDENVGLLTLVSDDEIPPRG